MILAWRVLCEHEHFQGASTKRSIGSPMCERGTREMYLAYTVDRIPRAADGFTSHTVGSVRTKLRSFGIV